MNPKSKLEIHCLHAGRKKKRIIELASGMPSRAVNGKMFHAFLAAAVADFTRCSNAKVEPNKHQKIIKMTKIIKSKIIKWMMVPMSNHGVKSFLEDRHRGVVHLVRGEVWVRHLRSDMVRI